MTSSQDRFKENVAGILGQNWNTSKNNRILSAYKWAVYKHCWNLTKQDREALDAFFLYRTTVDNFIEMINTEHDYIDMIRKNEIDFTISYLHCSLHSLEITENNQVLLLSFRHHVASKLAICLVWLPRPQDHILANLSKFQELPV